METNELEDLMDLVAKAGSENTAESQAAVKEFSAAAATVVRDSLWPDKSYYNLFNVVDYPDQMQGPTYITDLVQPGREKDFMAFSTPEVGGIPKNFAQPNSFTVPSVTIRSSVEIPRKVLRMKNYPTVKKVVENLLGGLDAKLNHMCFGAAIATGIANGDIKFVQADTANTISKTLIRLLKIAMQRGGGRYTSKRDFMLRDMFLSVEAHSSLVELDNTKLDEVTRRTVVFDDDGYLASLMGVKFHSMKEFGVAAIADYQNLFAAIGGTMPGNPAKTEIILGADGTKNAFELAVLNQPFIEEDVTASNRNAAAWFINMEAAGVVLDPRAARLAAC